MKVVASEWCRTLEEKHWKAILRHPDVQSELYSVAAKLAAEITAKFGRHSKTGRLAGSVSAPKKGTGRSRYRYYIVVGKGVAYVLAHEHGRKTNGAYEGFHEIEGELEW